MRRDIAFLGLLLSLFRAAAPAGAATLPPGFQPLAEPKEAQYDLRLTVAGPSPLTLLCGVQDPAKGYRLTLTPTASVLTRLDDEKTELARGEGAATPKDVVLRRRETMLYLLVDGRRVLSAMDGSYHAGAAAWQVPTGSKTTVTAANPAVQAVEDLFFADDFMRTADQQQLGVWTHVAGKWRFYSVSETNPKADVKLSVNPFSLGLTPAEPGGVSAVVAGQSFWDDYDYQVSIKSRGGSWGGILFAGKNPKDTFLLRADLSGKPMEPRRIELVRIEGDKETVLAGGTSMLSSDQWMRLGARLRGPRLTCYLDGDPIFERIDPALAGGQIGLWSKGPDEVLFDDVRCATNLTWPMDRAADLKSAGVPQLGRWQLAAAGGEPIANDPGRQQLVAAEAATSRYLLGDPAGQGWRLDTTVKPSRAGYVGLLFGWQDPQNYCAAVWTPQGQLQLKQVLKGVQTTPATVADLLEPGSSHDVALDLIEDGRVNVRRDGKLRLRITLAAPAGRMGLAVSDTAAAFSQIALSQDVPKDTEVEVDNSVFANDPFMLNWASSLADWYPEGGPENNPAWTAPPKEAAVELPGVGVDGFRFDKPIVRFQALPRLLVAGEPQGSLAAQDAQAVERYWHKGDFFQAYRIEVPTNKGPLSLLLNAKDETWPTLAPPAAVVPPATATGAAPAVGSAPLGGTVRATAPAQVVVAQAAPAALPAAVSGAAGATAAQPAKPAAPEGNGYMLQILDGGTDKGQLVLYRMSQKVQTVALPKDVTSVSVHRDGGVVWVQTDAKDLLVYHDAKPLTGTRVGLRTTNPQALWHIKVRREGVVDEVFEKAPADWVEQGEWIITNRFSCTPTWSHMTGMARNGLSALWHKDAFPGDMTIEYYAGMRMQSDLAYYYPRPGDFNATFGCKPFDLDSGLSLIPGAWDPGWTGRVTRFAMGNKSIVETDRPLVPVTREAAGARFIPVPYISAGRDVHGAWYYVKGRNIGGQLEGYFDNVKVLTGATPELKGDRVAVWSQDDEIVISRVRITYTKKVIPKRLLSRDPVTAAPAGAPGLLASVAKTPALSFDWNGSLQGWHTADEFRGVSLAPQRDNGRTWLLVRNHLPGDRFEAISPLRAAEDTATTLEALADFDFVQPVPATAPAPTPFVDLPLAQATALSFQYCIPPETKINLYVSLNGEPYFVPLTGPNDDSPILRRLLTPPQAVVADGKWHALRLPLGVALRRRFGKSPVKMSDLRFGMDHQGYLLAGFGGNPAGAWYGLANLALTPEIKAGSDVALNAKVMPGIGGKSGVVKQMRVALDARPDTLPTAAPTAAVLAPSAAGPAWLHAQAQLEDGSLTTAVHLPLAVATAEPELMALDAAKPWDGGPVAVTCGESAPVDLTATVAGKPLTWEQAVTADADGRRLWIDPAAARGVFKDGQKVPFELTATSALGTKKVLKFDRTYQVAADKLRPITPEVTGGGWSLEPDSAIPATVLGETTGTACEYEPNDGPRPGDGSLKFTNLHLTGSLRAQWVPSEVNLGQCPVLLFDYKMAAPVRWDLALSVGSDAYLLNFTDMATSYGQLGAIAEPQRDGKWHRAQANLQSMLAARREFMPNMYHLASLASADMPYSGEAPGANWSLGGARLAKVVSATKGFALSWSGWDAGGISKWRYGLSADENAAPKTEVPGDKLSATFASTPAAPLAEGLAWFAVQGCDAAGNWSRVRRVPLLVDAASPSFGTPVPAAGQLGTSDLTIPVANLGAAALDPATLVLGAGATKVQVGPGEVDFDATKNTLRWHWAWATKQFSGPVADGTPLAITAAGSDFAGNALPPQSWQYQVSYAADKQAPSAPEVAIAGEPLAALKTFNRGVKSRRLNYSSYQSMDQVVWDAERNDWVAQLATGQNGVALVAGAPIDLDQDPYLSFDYKLTPGTTIHLLLAVNGTNYAVALNGKNRSYTEIGAAEVVPDGKWHTLLIDMLQMVRTHVAKEGAVKLSTVLLSEYGSGAGLGYWLDNIAVFGPMPAKQFDVSWLDYDATGIAAAGARLDVGLDGTAPPPVTPGQTKTTLTAPAAGNHLLLVQCKDGAGNLSGIARRVVVVK